MNIFIYLTEKNQGYLGGIFKNYKKDNFEKNFKFVRDVGLHFKYYLIK